ncbi:MAG TPA: FAD-dependent oxidoreductase [Pseudonocardia sp.]|uniref:FAD-dependent oxidoreductase n=1 Tax=Pseudonocardia sp. TaxID=60912 RepID=UPI002EDB0916
MSRSPGRDRRAVALAGHAGAARLAPDHRPRVLIIGAGIAGLASATVLAERGAQVLVCERRSYVGGRVGGWPTTLADGTAVTMSRGFHAFFRQYYNLRALLARTDPALSRLRALADYPLWHAGGHRESFAAIPRTPPFNALGYLLHSPSFRWSDLARVNARTALSLLDVSVPGTYRQLDRFDAASYLRDIRFPPATHALALEVFSRSFFCHPERLSAAELATMFHIYFLGSAEGLLFDVPTTTFPKLWAPLVDRLRGLGGEVRTEVEVTRLAPVPGGGFAVGITGGGLSVDAVVLAADVPGARRIVAASPELGDQPWRERIARLRTAEPFQVSRLWLDRPVRPDRPPFLGTSGYDLLDNISVLDRYEDEARRWATRTGGSVVELHGYAVPGELTEGQAHDRLLTQLHRVYPETAAATVIDRRGELRADCPLFPPGGFADRPEVTTPDERLVLAGDFVRADLPVALMERAATTGFLAANALLRRWGVAGEPLCSVPTSGRNPLLRRVARRWGRPPSADQLPAPLVRNQ